MSNSTGRPETKTATKYLADLILQTRFEDISPEAITVAKQCLLDWIGVSLAARNEPLVRILLEEVAGEVQARDCTLLAGGKANLLNAALINGATSHALDFDDVIIPMGHPTVPVAPAVFALAEKLGASGRETLLAFVLGVEIECRIARYMGASHYAKGWHGTATFGTFGAMAAAAKLWRLDRGQILHAFGLSGTQAAGLKSVFGTMAKPLHPGKAAQNGLFSAQLAKAGFTSDTNILASEQGFGWTQSTTRDEALLHQTHPNGHFMVDALFKYHAACYLTHNAIEATDALRRKHDARPGEVERVLVRVPASHLGVCNIQTPRTGLECKFSLRMTAALALSGEDTFDETLFSDATAGRWDLVMLRERVTVEGGASGDASLVTVVFKDGREATESADVAIPMRDLTAQQAKVERKFNQLAARAIGSEKARLLIDICQKLEREKSVDRLLSNSPAREATRL